MAPPLVSDDFNRSSSTLKAATLERLSDGCLSASGHKGKMLVVEREETGVGMGLGLKNV